MRKLNKMGRNLIYFSSVEVDKRKMKENLIYFVIILIIISLDPKMVYWSSEGKFSNASYTNVKFIRKNTRTQHDHKFHLTSTENIHEHHCTPFYQPFLGGQPVLHCQPKYEGLVGKSCFRPYRFLPFIETYMFLI